ncbi:SapC family protein [Simiduia curdlanivorans]|uniref:SapC family protein n=1 Tax=Simiduia curdlanivorans TaxID=1492769 RepID=A0ABV8V593_9GAMM|nr:SapC family protein [Simiduia curdlanivorans]MDN3640723.1 SapC family protein [Simiduia curdlanivorans]
MTTFTVLDDKKHQQLRLDLSKAALAMKNQPLVPVVVSEFLKLVVHFPIVIVKQADTGHFGCSVLMGLGRGENLFLNDAQWQGLYWPANIRRQPFHVGQEDDNWLVCFNADHQALGTEKGELLFNQGRDSQCLGQAKSALAELVNGEALTRGFLQRLEALALLSPLQLEIADAENKPYKLSGLYGIDERKLNQLASEQLMALQRAGDLSLIYTLLASHGQIYALVQRKQQLQSAEVA